MVLSEADIKKFQQLYHSEFGIETSKEDAYEKGIKLLVLLSAVYKPMTEQELELVQKRRSETLPLLTKRISNEIKKL